jgi:hypothetical protein
MKPTRLPQRRSPRLTRPAFRHPALEPPSISMTMSANEILQRYPQARSAFDQLRINRLREGYESVDELAWRHGVDAEEFLERLRRLCSGR